MAVDASRRRLDYLCLQPTREGQASYAHVNEIVTGLRRRGWHVRLIEAPLPRPGASDGLRRALSAATVQLRYWFSVRFRPARVVYIRTHFLALPSALVARLAGSVVVQEMNGPIEDAYDAWPQLRRIDRLIAFAYRSQLRWADLVITVTPGLAGYVREFAGRDHGFAVIGNGADVERFRPMDQSRPDAVARYVVFVGALASWQGIDTILAAAASDAWPAELDLVIAGDGKESGRVEAAVRENPRVRWLGVVPYAQSASLVAQSAMALVPMNDVPRSGFGLSPLKLFEAMAAGVPVVASDLPGLAEIIREHRCGVVFRAGDGRALAEAVAALNADPVAAHAMGQRGHDSALERYSWDARAGQTQAAIEAAIKPR
jgi:glycosyltransferase involved in cell wall biosynthesis